MKNTEMPAIRLMPESIMRSFIASGKKHLFITGSKGIGKTTLVNELVKQLPNNTAGIKTKAMPKTKVIFTVMPSEESFDIGIFDSNVNHMVPINDNLDVNAVSAIESIISHESNWGYIDELGYLETNSCLFKNSVDQLLSKKRMLIVLRKQSTDFLDTLRQRKDCFLIDLDTPVKKIGCIIMASGQGLRFDDNRYKLLEDFNGQPLISHILNLTSSNLFNGCIVVTRNSNVKELCEIKKIPCILHNFPGRNDTIRLGLSWLNEHFQTDGCMFTVSDQPLLTKESIETLVLSHSHTNLCKSISRLVYENTPGNPVIFDKSYYESLLNLPPNTGGNYVIKENMENILNVPVFDAKEIYDIDTKADLEQLKKR